MPSDIYCADKSIYPLSVSFGDSSKELESEKLWFTAYLWTIKKVLDPILKLFLIAIESLMTYETLFL